VRFGGVSGIVVRAAVFRRADRPDGNKPHLGGKRRGERNRKPMGEYGYGCVGTRAARNERRNSWSHPKAGEFGRPTENNAPRVTSEAEEPPPIL
jgi:hypothetical protein